MSSFVFIVGFASYSWQIALQRVDEAIVCVVYAAFIVACSQPCTAVFANNRCEQDESRKEVNPVRPNDIIRASPGGQRCFVVDVSIETNCSSMFATRVPEPETGITKPEFWHGLV